MKILTATLAVLTVAATAFASARLTYDLHNQATSISWPATASPISYSIDPKVVATFPGSQAEIDAAFNQWSAIAGTGLRFRAAGPAGGHKFEQDGVNLVTLASDMFGDSGYLASTTNWFDSEGQILESDIQIDPKIAGRSYNLQQVVAHEVGHFIGLDHSAVVSSIMFPFIPTAGQPTFDSDDRLVVATMYPPQVMPSPGGAVLRGSVDNATGGIFAAQVVAVNEHGEPVATALTDASGNFEIAAVPTGDYRIYAEPLDGPVTTSNLAGVYRGARSVSFRTQFVSAQPLHVENGMKYGNLILHTDGALSSINPKFVGVTAGNGADVSLRFAPALVRGGATVSIAVGGDGFTAGMTTFEVLGPGFKRVSDFRYALGYVSATFDVASTVLSGSAVIMVHNGSDTAALTGALRVDGMASVTKAEPRGRIARK